MEYLPVGEIKGLKVAGAEAEETLRGRHGARPSSSRAPETCSATCSGTT